MSAISPSVTEFIANFQGGGARPNLYNVILTFPLGIGSAQESRKASFTCRSASLPASNMGLVQVPYMGRQVKIAGDKTFDDWTITIINDSDFSVRDAFERWTDRISGHVGNVAAPGFGNPTRYFANAEVIQLDREDYEVKSYFFEGIFPTSVSDIQMGFDQNDMVEEFTVTLAVNYWRAYTTT
jgi:hypothetical protein